MRVIIIEDKDARALLDALKLERFEQADSDKQHWDIIQKVHQQFHYHVCTWLQDQGCQILR